MARFRSSRDVRTSVGNAPQDGLPPTGPNLWFKPPVCPTRLGKNRNSCPASTGKSLPRAKTCLVPAQKIFRFFRNPNQSYVRNRPGPIRGAYRDRHGRWAGMRWTRSRQQTTDAGADGQAVWSWRSEAGAKFLRSKLLRDDGGNQAMVTGESAEYAVKTIARGRPGILG